MGTNEYLAKLNLDQLIYARDKAQALISEKQHEKKIVYWRVEDDRGCLIDAFAEQDYLKAAEKLLEEAVSNAASKTMRPRDMALSLKPDFVVASEYAELGLPAPVGILPCESQPEE